MNEIRALVVHQWLSQWDSVKFLPEELRSKPEPVFYLFQMPATLLRRLAGIQRRERKSAARLDLGIQRRHDVERSEEIRRYVRGGYPWSTLKLESADIDRFPDIRMPGWLPTAIVVNILTPEDKRYEVAVHSRDLVELRRSGNASATLVLPSGCESRTWRPAALPPIEVIDGQHRLWAFDLQRDEALDGAFELPVVAFRGLDVGWQAYLFWTINVKPKRISSSLAFDLYPLLRTQSWLETATAEGPLVYRETRAQELTETLWSHPASPWKGRINMLGEPGGGDVSQAAFIRSLLASYVKRSAGRGVSIGGLFGSELDGGRVLPWTRTQQAAFLLFIWKRVKETVERSNQPWAKDLVERTGSRESLFAGPFTLLAADQGVRGVLQVTNDLIALRAAGLELERWRGERSEEVPSEGAVSEALRSLERELGKAVAFIGAISEDFIRFDWRSSAAPGLDTDTRLRQAAYRGSGGYKELRIQLLRLLARSDYKDVARTASEAARRLGYSLE